MCGVQYQVVALNGRQHNQKIEAILEAKYEEACSKKITLNERFGVNEKGYTLQAGSAVSESTDQSSKSQVFLTVHERNLISKKNFIENYLAKHPTTEVAEEEDKENAHVSKNVKKSSVTKDVFNPNVYVGDFAKAILKTM
uniref:Uncharacterized protein n=1 Tax=Caenorhabditis japonica TaxID=281687 RepID=A0A8R1ERQ1_CAEJA